MEVSEKRIEEIIHSYQPDRRYALAIMQDMQREFQYVPREGMEALAEELQCPVSSLYAMATFYKALSLVPNGKVTLEKLKEIIQGVKEGGAE